MTLEGAINRATTRRARMRNPKRRMRRKRKRNPKKNTREAKKEEHDSPSSTADASDDACDSDASWKPQDAYPRLAHVDRNLLTHACRTLT